MIRIFLSACVLALVGCGEPPPTLSPLPPNAVILSFGDSLTHGTGAKPDESYPAVLGSLIARQVVRAGVPGEVSARGLERLSGALEQYQPALVILCHGGNDLLRKLSHTALASNLTEMIATIRGTGAEVLLLGVPQPALLGLDSADVYREVATQMAVPLLEDALPQILSKGALKSDHIHPNAAGYAQLAQEIAAFLMEAGAL